MLCARLWICWGFLPKLIPVFQSSVSHVVAQIQGYHLICMWGRLVKFHGGGVVLKTILCARLWICWVFIPVFQSSVSPSNWEGFGLVGCHVVAQIQGYHLICIVLCFVLDCGFAEFLYRGLSLSFKAQCLPQIEGVLCHVVAQTQGYHLVCIWGSLVRFQGVRLF